MFSHRNSNRCSQRRNEVCWDSFLLSRKQKESTRLFFLSTKQCSFLLWTTGVFVRPIFRQVGSQGGATASRQPSHFSCIPRFLSRKGTAPFKTAHWRTLKKINWLTLIHPSVTGSTTPIALCTQRCRHELYALPCPGAAISWKDPNFLFPNYTCLLPSSVSHSLCGVSFLLSFPPRTVVLTNMSFHIPQRIRNSSQDKPGSWRGCFRIFFSYYVLNWTCYTFFSHGSSRRFSSSQLKGSTSKLNTNVHTSWKPSSIFPTTNINDHPSTFS